ncbi:YhcN/YlaJ family sporulation lipoprotein [Bacillus sp. EB600]|uniref:YhcN/YlaJ family sporulation lipoprotein n=1 Tax=Bacillus sp. EB600 TaxID=2806345 RepID=UPI00210C6445|nr:YhcN/YlaJ family sporulation lipoprotein [Bacillus sp. EB600]MCQ6278982.1 YhcN/YlaJ family sporulation lipoprotein [Bacillus sp. EB600]
MKKLACIAGLCMITALTGCANDTNNRGIYEKSGNTLNVNNKRTELYNEGGASDVRNISTNYGYVRHQKSPIMNDNNNHYASLNREQVANIISRYSTNIPNVNDVATLVTDQEVLIAYQTDSKDRNLTADQVKRTAMSVVPRYYHVYVTDQQSLLRDVENLSHLDSTSRNARNSVNHLITQMKKSPQGAPMNNSENANGETADDKMYRTK